MGLLDLRIADDKTFSRIPLYAALEQSLVRSKYTFRTLPRGASWDRAAFLNLTYWAPEMGGDVLTEKRLGADVVAHVALHQLVAHALPNNVRRTSAALFLGESVASAFDVYLLGWHLRLGASSEFMETQLSAMSEVATSAGLTTKRFESLLQGCAEDPLLAFESLRGLLYAATSKLLKAKDPEGGERALRSFAQHPFYPLLHHYELSNWVLFAKAYGDRTAKVSPVSRLEREFRGSKETLASLVVRSL
ncbi:MAG: hypothetical protein KBF88_10660 [Polyangiaceae bacterium]|nr:hypothetical protein [Polyangiaceae bacterium]